MADKEILNTADLEDRIQRAKNIYLTINREIWTKTSVNIIALSILRWLCIV